jgi:hypothetical protein
MSLRWIKRRKECKIRGARRKAALEAVLIDVEM